MRRVVRVGALLVLLAGLVAVGSVVVPAHWDYTTGEAGPTSDCTFYFQVGDSGPVFPEDYRTATPYNATDQLRRQLFDRWHNRNGTARLIEIDRREWRPLYEGVDSTQYVVYEDRLYRTDVSFDGCSLWQALSGTPER
jgi:hypothetical protein